MTELLRAPYILSGGHAHANLCFCIRNFFQTINSLFLAAQVTDVKVLGAACDIPVRVYQPSEEAPSQVLVYFHGGGFTMGSIKSHDAVCRRLTSTSQVISGITIYIVFLTVLI